jgi:acetoin utilization transport system permease protein
MFNRALWMKNYKQAKYLIWAFIVITLIYPINLYFEGEGLLSAEKLLSFSPSNYNFNPSLWISILQMICVVTLASILQGLERSNQGMDFSLALPYKRKDILLSKWSIGVVTIVGTNLVVLLISIPILLHSVLLTYISIQMFFLYFVTSTTILIGIYSLSLIIGQLVGNHIAQFVVSWMLLLLPFLLSILTVNLLIEHNYLFVDLPEGIRSKSILYALITTMPVYLAGFDRNVMLTAPDSFTNVPNDYYFIALITPLVITALFLAFANFNSLKIKSENNGSLLLYKELEPVLTIGIFIISYLLGGWVWPDFGTSSLLGYHVGGIIFGLTSYFIITKVLGNSVFFKNSKKV